MRAPSAIPASSRLLGSAVASIAAILEIEASEVPMPESRHPEPWTVWSQWLLLRKVGLVPIEDPKGFDWPGPWLALMRSADGDGQVAGVAFGAPPGLAWHPLDGPETFNDVEAGFVIAPCDVAVWTHTDGATAPRSSGTVEAILVAPDAEGEMHRVQSARAEPGRGLEGDRYFEHRGTFSSVHSRGHDLTLIEAEMLESLDLPAGELSAEDARRNIVTRGIDLNAIVGKPFRVGDVECFAQRLCEPCAHLERLTSAVGKPGTLRALIHKGGLRADIIGDGVIRVGDAVSPVRQSG